MSSTGTSRAVTGFCLALLVSVAIVHSNFLLVKMPRYRILTPLDLLEPRHNGPVFQF